MRTRETSPLLIGSFVLAGIAVAMLITAAWMVWSGVLLYKGRWLVVSALGPAGVALACGAWMVYARGGVLARISCIVAVLCIVVVPAMLCWRVARRKAVARRCIANMRNVDSVFPGYIEEPSDDLKGVTNSALIHPNYLKNPKSICCPLSPGMPYSCSPNDTDGTTPDVTCPNSGTATDHML